MRNRGVDLRRADTRMAEHLRDHLDRDTLREGQRRGEGVAGRMEGDRLLDLGTAHQVGQAAVAPAVARQRKDRPIGKVGGVFAQDGERKVEEAHLDGLSRLVTCRLDPVATADMAHMADAQLHQINERKPRKAAEQKAVADEPMGRRQPFEGNQAHQLIGRQEVARHKLAPQLEVGKEVGDRIALRSRTRKEVFERGEIDPHRVTTACAVALQVGVKAGEEVVIQLAEQQITALISGLQEAFEVELHGMVAVERRAAARDIDLLFKALTMTAEEVKERGLIRIGHKEAFAHHRRGGTEVLALQLGVAVEGALVEAVEVSVDMDHLGIAPYGAVLLTIPRRGRDREAGRELCTLTVERNTPHDRRIAVGLQRIAFEVEE